MVLVEENYGLFGYNTCHIIRFLPYPGTNKRPNAILTLILTLGSFPSLPNVS